MPWLDRDRYYTGKEGKDLWLIFSSQEHVPFFKQMGDHFLRRFDIDICLMWNINLGHASISISPWEILLGRCDLLILDTSFLLEDEYFNIHNIEWRLSQGSYLVFTSDDDHVQRVERVLTRKDGEQHFYEPVSIDRNRLFSFPMQTGHTEFMRLCRQVEEAVLKYHRSKIFLCHAGEDHEFAEKLAHSLSKKGVPVWYDRWILNVGDSIVDRVNEGIHDSRYMGVVLSKHSVSKPWCRREMNAALQIQLNKDGIRILPIVIDDCEVPELFADLLRADFRISYRKGLNSLLKSLQTKDTQDANNKLEATR
jgi:hypothetical protein